MAFQTVAMAKLGVLFQGNVPDVRQGHLAPPNPIVIWKVNATYGKVQQTL